MIGTAGNRLQRPGQHLVFVQRALSELPKIDYHATIAKLRTEALLVVDRRRAREQATGNQTQGSGGNDKLAADAKNLSEVPAEPTRATKAKRSTERDEARRKLISALTMHHRYADGGCLNLEPIGGNQLARLAKVAHSTGSEFFKREFKGHTKYRAVCTDATQLVAALKLLNQEFSPYDLYGGKPPGEDERDEEE